MIHIIKFEQFALTWMKQYFKWVKNLINKFGHWTFNLYHQPWHLFVHLLFRDNEENDMTISEEALDDEEEPENEDSLWVQYYSPQRYTHLLSDEVRTIAQNILPRKHVAFTQCCFNVGPASKGIFIPQSFLHTFFTSCFIYKKFSLYYWYYWYYCIP